MIFCTNYRILEDEPIMRQLLTNRAGMTLVMLGTAMTQLPKECHIVLNMQGGDGYLHSSEGDTRKIDFEYPDRGLIKSFSRPHGAHARARCGPERCHSHAGILFGHLRRAPRGNSWKSGACGRKTTPTTASSPSSATALGPSPLCWTFPTSTMAPTA